MQTTSPSSATRARNRAELEQFFAERLKRLAPVATTQTPAGQTLDWVPREAQLGGAPLATPPPAPTIAAEQRERLARPELANAGVARGPAGTVPFRRPDVTKMTDKLSLVERARIKVPPPPPGFGQKAEAAGVRVRPAIDYTGHYYGNTGQSITNYGGTGTLSAFSPAVSLSGHFSLLQIGVSNSQQGTLENTVEAGWIVSPGLYGGDYNPHLFTFFNTNGYSAQGDNIGGWDTQVQGWVQNDANYFPGMTFSPLSQTNGPQQEITIQYQLFNGNWWFAAQGVWMGYYPASLFAVVQTPGQPASTANTLGDHGDGIGFWGEVYDPDYTPPTTEMGSGEFANIGWGWSAYMHNLLTQTDASGTTAAYDGGAGSPSDATLYSISANPGGTDSWGSSMWLGGPGGGHTSVLAAPASHAQEGLTQTDVFSINSRGSLQVAWVDGGGWSGPGPIGGDNLYVSGGGLVATPRLGSDGRTDVFSVDQSGQMTYATVVNAGNWDGPVGIGTAGTFPVGAPVAASQQMGITQSDIFCINNDGALTVSYAFEGGDWNYAGPIGGDGIFDQGAHVAACAWFGTTNRTAVFAVDTAGALRLAWVESDGAWNGPYAITANGLFPPGAPLAAGQQIGVDQTDVFCVDNTGALTVVYSYEGDDWAVYGITGPGTFNLASPVATCQQVGLTQTDVFCVDSNGTLTVCWIVAGQSWGGPSPISTENFCVPAAAMTASQQIGLNQTDVIVPDRFGDLAVFWVDGGGTWQGPLHS